MHSSCTLKPSLCSSLAPFVSCISLLGLKEKETTATQANSSQKKVLL